MQQAGHICAYSELDRRVIEWGRKSKHKPLNIFNWKSVIKLGVQSLTSVSNIIKRKRACEGGISNKMQRIVPEIMLFQLKRTED